MKRNFFFLFFLLWSFSLSAETVKRSVDGDTLALTDGKKVRLLGVDTPETKHPFKSVQCYGPQASEFTHHEMDGRKVVLIQDEGNKTDKYHRTLAYVYRDDGFFLNRELLLRGYARAYLKFQFSKKEEFIILESRAKKAKRGLWGKCP